MLERTLVHLKGVGPVTEKRLWRAGIRSLEELRQEIPAAVPAHLRGVVAASVATAGDLALLPPAEAASQLPVAERWRLFRVYRETACYLDIETDTSPGGEPLITTVALYDGVSVYTFVRGENLGELAAVLAGYDLLVTFNGSCFDLPVIERSFGLTLSCAHIDLRYILRRLGFAGGLKACERAVGIDRGELAGLSGLDAVLLWRRFRRTGDRRALETLLAYNVEDAVNLESLMVHAYNRFVAQTPFAEECVLEMPRRPEIPFRPDPETVEWLQRATQGMRE